METKEHTKQANYKAMLFSLILIVLAFVSIGIRSVLETPQNVPQGDSIWELHWDFQFTKANQGAVVRLAVPLDNKFSQIFEQNIALQGMRIRKSRMSKSGTREIVAYVTRQQDVAIAIDYTLHLSPAGIPQYVANKKLLSTEQRQLYLSSTETLPASQESIIDRVHAISNGTEVPTSVIDALFSYCQQRIKTQLIGGKSNVLAIVSNGEANALGKARLLTTLARAARIPARIVMGVKLEETTKFVPHYWVEIYDNNQWWAYDPTEGYEKTVPYNYLAIQKNGESVISLTQGMKVTNESLEITQRDIKADSFKNAGTRLMDILDLDRLSISTRLTLAFLLLLPLGALLTVFLRQILGLEFYGTFTPTFFALAFSNVGWQTGGILLCLVMLVGLFGLSVTPWLGLNRLARLTMVFTVVAIALIFSVSLMVYYGLAPDGNIVLLPIVILTFTIDRIYRLIDSEGFKIAVIRLIWTLIVAAMIAAILQMDLLGLWLLKYPEAHLVTIALVILISQYKGAMWLRVLGLHWMLEPPKTKKSKTDSSNDD